MEEPQRRALRRGRARLVAALRVAPLWEPLEHRGVFTGPMVEEMQVGRAPGPLSPATGPREGPGSLRLPVACGWWPSCPLTPVTGPREGPVSP